MTNLAIVSKSTKHGISVWRFIQTEDGKFFAFGGCTPACKEFASLDELRTCYKNWISYGYQPGLVPEKAKKSIPLSDPWASQLPVSMQKELESLK